MLETALNVLQNNRDVQLCNNLLQVLLELDFGSTVYFVTKACEKEAESAGTSRKSDLHYKHTEISI